MLIGDLERDLARVLLAAQSEGCGTTPENEETVSMLEEWERRGWAESHIDSDGDRVFLLTYEGADALLGERPQSKS